MANLSTRTIITRTASTDAFQAPKQNNFQPRLLYPAKVSLKIEGEIKTFPEHK
jgi:hypothetical protein